MFVQNLKFANIHYVLGLCVSEIRENIDIYENRQTDDGASATDFARTPALRSLGNFSSHGCRIVAAWVIYYCFSGAGRESFFGNLSSVTEAKPSDTRVLH